MSEITLALEHTSLGYGEVIARYDLSEIQEKAYQQGRADREREIISMIKDFFYGWNKEKNKRRLSYFAMNELVEFIMQNDRIELQMKGENE